ncbi:antitoxin [Rickettsiaceae bacterium]|nr:antitoxin [Rickettsiaceae bacterium]
MIKLITATDVVRSFSDIIGRVYYKGETFEIKKGNNIVARLSPAKENPILSISDLNKFFKSSAHLSPEDVNDFEKEIKSIRSLKEAHGSDKWE